MKTFLLFMLMAVMATTQAFADATYSWEDADGIHFTDDPAAVPTKQKNVQKRAGITAQPAPDLNQQPDAVALVVPQKTVKELTEARNMVDALNKIHARAQIGITNKDYFPILGDTQYSYNKYMASKEADKYDDLTKNVKKAMTAYVDAGAVWDIKFQMVPVVKWMDPTSYEGKRVLSYSGMSQHIEYIPGTSVRMIYIDNVLGKLGYPQ